MKRAPRAVLTGLLACAAVAVGPAPAAAQDAERWSVELRAGTAVGDYQPASAGGDFAAAFAWGAAVSFAALPRLAVRAGYSRTGFGCTKGFCAERDVSFTGSGADVGVEWSLWANRSTPWLRASTLYHKLQSSGQLPQEPGTTSSESDLALGLEVAGGWLVRVRGRIALNPAVRFGSYRAKFSEDESGRVNHIATELGVRVFF